MISNISMKSACAGTAAARQRGAAAGLVFGQDHLAHGADALGVEEHVLGAAEADALGAELPRRLGIGGVSALVRTFSLRTGRPIPSASRNRPRAPARSSATAPSNTSPVRAVERDGLAGLNARRRASALLA
jgi:hypothetical protein